MLRLLKLVIVTVIHIPESMFELLKVDLFLDSLKLDVLKVLNRPYRDNKKKFNYRKLATAMYNNVQSCTPYMPPSLSLSTPGARHD